MRHSRFIFHPVIEHKKSRALFILFLLLALAAGVVFFWYVEYYLNQANLNLNPLYLQQHPKLKLLLSFYLRMGVVLMVSVIATGITARVMVGPIKRIEKWLEAWDRGHA